MMKDKLYTVMFVICLMLSVAIAQTDTATEVVTDDATMARLRVVNLVYESGAVDIYVNGDIALLGSPRRELTRVPVGFVPGYLYLQPGTHSVAFVPTGQSMENAMISEDVTLEAGHRYTVAIMGQTEDASFTPLVIDETAAVNEVRTSPEQTIMFLINNHEDLKTISLLEDGAGPQDVPYGGFVAAPIKAGRVNEIVATGMTQEGEVTLFRDGGFDEPPGIDMIIAYIGRGGASDLTEGAFSFQSELNSLELLKQFSDFGLTWDGVKLSFTTFLAAVETAGLSNMLTAGTYLIFPPTDSSFAALPDEQLEALLADPEALADFLRYHIVEGYYPVGSLSGATYGVNDITVTNMQGVDLRITGNSINGINVPSLPTFTVVNGTRIFPVTKVLLPPAN